MSDTILTLIPQAPYFIPNEEDSKACAELLNRHYQGEARIEREINPTPVFYHCGGNFDTVSCPYCKKKLLIEFWQECMDQDYDGQGFRLQLFKLPCCSKQATLNDLVYDFMQGFACYALFASETTVPPFPKKKQGQLERILKTKLKVIYCRI